MTMPGVTLSIEAAVGGGSISLFQDNEELSTWCGDTQVSRAEDILPAIDHLLRDRSLTIADLAAVCVSAGPGSFTGIRIGLATALGLATGLRVPLMSVNLLRAMADAADVAHCIAAVPMGRDAGCIQEFRRAENGLDEVDPPRTIPLDALDVTTGHAAIAIHGSLGDQLNSGRELVNFGVCLSSVVARFCIKHPGHAEEPIFVSKGF